MQNFEHEPEGVIKYRLRHRAGLLPEQLDLAALNAWRTLLHRLRLIGCNPDKYGGLGFGNISRRLVPHSSQFIISATQTGHIPVLQRQDYTLVESADPQQNRLQSFGPSPPSSEALTHAAVYQQDAAVQAVIHAHCPELWLNCRRLQLPHTTENIAYGTVEMVKAVQALFADGQLQSRPIFAMLGHEDGVVCFGDSVESAAQLLISELALALAIEQGAG